MSHRGFWIGVELALLFPIEDRAMLSLCLFYCLFWQDPNALSFLPSASRAANIPTQQQVLGYDFGEKISMHHEAIFYAQALAKASPRVTLKLRGETWEGRDMALLLVGSEHNIKRLETLREGYQALADPRKTSKGALAGLLHDLPALVWLQESVHGNEISGTDSGLLLAWHLASANDERTNKLLEQVVIGIELMQNPDGRDHFVQHTRRTRSPLGGDPNPRAAEHHPRWYSGRHNHYNFDMNRDWFAMTQPETRTKVASILKWRPHIVIDIHEMDGDSTFFAANPSPPANPLLSPKMQQQYLALGKAIGRHFDQRGLDYFHGETFDSFYPGYGESWPSLQGSVGILFEQGSARGQVWKRRNDTLLYHTEAVGQQALASYAVIEYAAQNRTEVLKSFYQRRQEALDNGKGFRGVFLLNKKDPTRVNALANLLENQGIEVLQTGDKNHDINAYEPGFVGTRNYDLPPKTAYVPFNQPAGRLARTLLLENIELDPDFLREEMERWRQMRASTRIYDVTGWSLPMLYGVQALYTEEKAKDTQAYRPVVPALAHADATRGFLVQAGLNTYPLLAALLQEGYRVSYSSKDITHNGHVFPRGSLILRHANNPKNLSQRIQDLAHQHQVKVVGTNTSWFEKGPGFGSGEVRDLKPPRVALAWNEPTNTMSAGWMRYVLEQRFGYRISAIRFNNLEGERLSDYDVLLMPSGKDWNDHLDEDDINALKHWLRQGGVLVSVGETTQWLADEKVELLATVKEFRGGIVKNGKKKPDPHPKKIEKDPEAMIRPRQEDPRKAFGALMRVALDKRHWMTAGMPNECAVMVHSNRILRPLRLDKGTNPGRFVERERLLMSGHAPLETLRQFAHKPFLMVTSEGRGLVIAFSEDPNYRAFVRGLEPLLGNAVFFGPAHARGGAHRH